MTRLHTDDLAVEAPALARALIGLLLVTQRDGVMTVGRIVETEAYHESEPAAHSYRGRTKRNAVMFGAPFHAYIYFIYGTSYCFNVTAEPPGVGGGVLVRALEPVAGIDVMAARRGAGVRDRDLCRGPGRLCRAMAIGPEDNGADLVAGTAIWLAGPRPPAARIGSSRRVGISAAVEMRWRFYAAGNPYLSGPRSLSPP